MNANSTIRLVNSAADRAISDACLPTANGANIARAAFGLFGLGSYVNGCKAVVFTNAFRDTATLAEFVAEANAQFNAAKPSKVSDSSKADNHANVKRCSAIAGYISNITTLNRALCDQVNGQTVKFNAERGFYMDAKGAPRAAGAGRPAKSGKAPKVQTDRLSSVKAAALDRVAAAAGVTLSSAADVAKLADLLCKLAGSVATGAKSAKVRKTA